MLQKNNSVSDLWADMKDHCLNFFHECKLYTGSREDQSFVFFLHFFSNPFTGGETGGVQLGAVCNHSTRCNQILHTGPLIIWSTVVAADVTQLI